MNKKGFTLVELLGVIVILAILATIATPIISTVQKNIKEKMWAAKIKMIREAAVLCAENEGINGCNQVNLLCEKGYLDRDEKVTNDVECQQNPVTGNSVGACQINLKYNNNNRWTATFLGKDSSGENSNCPID